VLTLGQPDGILFSGTVSHERAIVQASLRTALH
jgi:hypothetical protein